MSIVTTLVGQYVVEGWAENARYQRIVAVTVDRNELAIWARNPDGRLVKYDDNCMTVKQPPLLEERKQLQSHMMVTQEEPKDEAYWADLNMKLDEMDKRIRETISE